MRRPSGGAYPAGDYFFHQDDQGNVLLVTDASGAAVERYDYDDFGAPTILDPSTGQPRAVSAIGNRFLFTGREWDPDTKLYHYRFRDYDPSTGRFLQRDPLGLWGDLASLGNGTAYVGNNPWSRVDPYGLQMVLHPYELEWSMRMARQAPPPPRRVVQVTQGVGQVVGGLGMVAGGVAAIPVGFGAGAVVGVPTIGAGAATTGFGFANIAQ